MENEYYDLYLTFKKSGTILLENLYFSENYILEDKNYICRINCTDNDGINVKINLKNDCDNLLSIEYRFYLKMNNYSKVIVPDSGRWFVNKMGLIDFWKFCRNFSSDISDIKTPLYIFLEDSDYVGNAVGIIGKNIESTFKIYEPESNRALNVHTGKIVLGIRRGGNDYPLNTSSYDENIYYYRRKNINDSWLDIMQAYSEIQKRKYCIEEVYNKSCLYPMWCSWVDWDSKDITTEMILDNVKRGMEIEIKNYIVDDGWYGNGLDSQYSVDMDIGDWEPDINKIPDMNELVRKSHQIGANIFIWCAPHAVALKSKAYNKNNNLLIADFNGKPIINAPQYYSYCFQNADAREEMANICFSLIEKWGFDGIKLDLFNWVPNEKCENPNHTHDVNSMIEGLEKTFDLIYEKIHKIKPNFMIELKQNYGTLMNMKYGNIMRAGDSPFDIQTNFLRTLHIQGYTPHALNDYQTFCETDSEEKVACIIIKMLAAGIPAYGVNFKKLSNKIKKIIKYYNNLYLENIDDFDNPRKLKCPDNGIIGMDGNKRQYLFLLSNHNLFNIESNSLVFNASFKKNVFAINYKVDLYNIKIRDCFGRVTDQLQSKDKYINLIVPVGGTVEFSKLQ